MIGAALGNTTQTWRVVDREGKVHHTGLTYNQANAMLDAMVTSGPFAGFHTKPDNEPAPELPPHAAVAIKEAAEAALLTAIEPGSEREALKLAIDRRQAASTTEEQIQTALSRARELLTVRQSELDALTDARDEAIAIDGERLALALRSGDVSDDCSSEFNRSAILDAEARRDTARAAVDHLEKESTAIKKEIGEAEAARGAAIKAIMRSEAETLAEWLDELKQETSLVQAHISALRYRGVPISQKATNAVNAALQTDESAAGRKWSAFSDALTNNANAQLGALK